jgi:hypothetical protein
MIRNNYSFSKVESGIILKTIYGEEEFLKYHVQIENHHSHNDYSIGVPIFSFGYNSYTILPNSRVICLVKDNNYSTVFIVGQIYDPAILRNNMPPDPGQIKLATGGNQRSGITQIGDSDKISIYSGQTFIKLDTNSFNLSIGKNSFLDYSHDNFILKLNEQNEGLYIKGGKTNFITPNGFYVNSNSGSIYTQGQKFSFTEGNNEKPNLLISKGLHRNIGVESVNIFSKYSFSASSARIKGSSDSVDWNVITGSYAIRLGTGDFKVNLLNASGAEVYFKIGIGPAYLSQFSFTQSVLEVKIGVALPDSLKLGGGSLAVKVGNFPGLQSELLLEESNAELKVKGLLGDSTFTHKSTSIKFENNSLVTGASASFEIASGKLTLKSASKALSGKIILDGEVEITGNVTVKGSTGIEATSGDIKAGTISLKNHKHASSIPGGPTPPTPG